MDPTKLGGKFLAPQSAVPNPWARLVILLMVLVVGVETTLGQTVQKRPVPVSLRPTTVMAASDQMLALGKKLYTKECAPCDGLDGRGTGEAAYLLYPRPCDFVTPYQFRLISTWERVPTDADLFFTISRGIPGSAMRSWVHLPEETRWAFVHYIKSFAERLRLLRHDLSVFIQHVAEIWLKGYSRAAPQRARDLLRDYSRDVGFPSGP